MRLYAKCILVAAVLTASLALFGQEQQRFSQPDLLAKLSFDNSGTRLSQGIQHICMAVNRDGSYRMIRTPGIFRMIPRQSPDWPDRPGTDRLEGTLSQEQLLQFKTLLGPSDLRPFAGNHSGIILESAQIFMAEIPESDKQVSDRTLHIQLLNPDGKNPFPPAVSKIVDWLNGFEPKNAKPSADLEFQDVCPSVGFQLLQPSVASNAP